MKIAVNASMLDDNPSGVGVYTINVINGLSRLADKNKYYFEIFTAVAGPLELNDNWKIKNITKYVKESEYKKFASPLRFIWNLSTYPFLARNFEISYHPTTHGSIFLNNQVLTIQDLLALRFPKQSKLQYYYFKYYLPVLVSRAKAIISSSQSTKSDIIKFTGCKPEKIYVVYGGYNDKLFFPRPGAKAYVKNKYKIDRYLLAVGATYPHKNIERLMTAFSRLPEYLKDELHLVITGGREDYSQKLKLWANQEKIGNKVKFLRYVSDDDLPALYSGAESLVYPSLYEGFGLPPLEAMACGCPAIVSNIASLPEVCGESACYIDPLNIDSIRDGIAAVLTNADYREELSRKGLSRAALFPWEKTVKGILEVFAEIGQGRKFP